MFLKTVVFAHAKSGPLHMYQDKSVRRHMSTDEGGNVIYAHTSHAAQLESAGPARRIKASHSDVAYAIFSGFSPSLPLELGEYSLARRVVVGIKCDGSEATQHRDVPTPPPPADDDTPLSAPPSPSETTTLRGTGGPQSAGRLSHRKVRRPHK